LFVWALQPHSPNAAAKPIQTTASKSGERGHLLSSFHDKLEEEEIALTAFALYQSTISERRNHVFHKLTCV